MRVLAPIEKLIEKLVKNKFVVRDRAGLPQATARKDLVLLSHYEIINFYNHRIQGVLNFYSFCPPRGIGNRTNLRKIILFFQLSCALTLALKFKLRTKRAAFKAFGRTLKDKITGVELKLPKTLVAIHDYKGFKENESNSASKIDDLLAQS